MDRMYGYEVRLVEANLGKSPKFEFISNLNWGNCVRVGKANIFLTAVRTGGSTSVKKNSLSEANARLVLECFSGPEEIASLNQFFGNHVSIWAQTEAEMTNR